MVRKSPSYRKERTIKIIEVELDAKAKLANATNGLRRPDILSNGKSFTKKLRKAQDEADIDEGIQLSDGSSAIEDNEIGPDESVNENEDDEEDETVAVSAVARAANGKVKGVRGRNERVMSAAEVRNHIRLLFKNESELCALIFGRHGGSTRSLANTTKLADMFFMDAVPVTPTRFRPVSKLGDDLFENSQNTLLTAVLTTCQRIQELNQRLLDQVKAERGEIVLYAVAKAEGTRTFEQLLDALIKLQHDVNSFMDSTKNPAIVRQGKLPPQGIKQLLERKEGLFRKHMMVHNERKQLS